MNHLKIHGRFSSAASLLPAIAHHLSATDHYMPLIDLTANHPILAAELLAVFESPFFRTRIFVTPPRTETGIHVDGSTWENGSKWAVNFPIVGCDGTEFKFYRVRQVSTNPRTHNRPDLGASVAMSFIKEDVLEELESVELDSPTLVNTNVAHNVVNSNSAPRAILSVRFERSLITSFHEEVQRLKAETT